MKNKPEKVRRQESSLSVIKQKNGTESSEGEFHQKKLGKFASLDQNV